MGHLDELQEKYEEQGFTVLAVTREPKSRVEEFIEDLDPKHMIATVPASDIEAFGISGYPSAFLVGGDGEIVWAGHPAGLQPATIEEALKTVQLLPDFPKVLKPIEKLLDKEKHGDAIKKLEKLLAGKSLEEDERAVGEKVLEHVSGRGTGGLEKAAKLLREGSYVDAHKRYEKLSKQYKGHDIGKQAKEAAAKMMSDKAIKAEIQAREKWEKVKREIEGLAPKKAIKKIRPLLAKKYRDTVAGKLAEKKYKELERYAK